MVSPLILTLSGERGPRAGVRLREGSLRQHTALPLSARDPSSRARGHTGFCSFAAAAIVAAVAATAAAVVVVGAALRVVGVQFRFSALPCP